LNSGTPNEVVWGILADLFGFLYGFLGLLCPQTTLTFWICVFRLITLLYIKKIKIAVELPCVREAQEKVVLVPEDCPIECLLLVWGNENEFLKNCIALRLVAWTEHHKEVCVSSKVGPCRNIALNVD